ncbi:MAG: hypothetical protein V2I43_27275 [Parvularcula sp.]|jgi:hypothetical protein|nr:hypothetical protein [Parvularcula sp.]
MNMMTKPETPADQVNRHQITLFLGGAEVGTDRARTILEILLEDEDICTNERLGALIGTALDQLDQVKKSVAQTLNVAGND